MDHNATARRGQWPEDMSAGWRAGDGGPWTHSFWDTQTSGQAASAGGTGKTTAEMQMASTFLEAGWDFVGETANGTEDIWWIQSKARTIPGLLVGVHVVCFLAGPTEWLGRRGWDVYPELARRGRGHRVRRVLRQRPQPRGQCDERVKASTCGRQPADVTSYDPGPLEWGQTYYWRVDEVNATPDFYDTGGQSGPSRSKPLSIRSSPSRPQRQVSATS